MLKTRLMVVDDHEVVRMGMRQFFEPTDDFTVVGEASNGSEALLKVPVLDPQLILMDVRMEKMDGIEACREIKSQHPQVHILMVTSYTDSDATIASAMAGASGYLLKILSRDELLRSVRLVAAGKTLIDPSISQRAIRRLTPVPGNELTRREREVLVLIGKGCTNKQIGQKLSISEKTARNHVSHILAKLNFPRRRGLYDL